MSNSIETLANAVRAWSDHDLDGYLKLYSPQVTVTGLMPEPIGLDGVRKFYEAVFSGFSDMRLEVLDTLEDGDKVAARYRVSGTHDGDFQGVPASKKSVAAEGITLFRFSNGLVVERANSFDLFGLMSQIGALGTV